MNGGSDKNNIDNDIGNDANDKTSSHNNHRKNNNCNKSEIRMIKKHDRNDQIINS